jgi:hypothetical protein
MPPFSSKMPPKSKIHLRALLLVWTLVSRMYFTNKLEEKTIGRSLPIIHRALLSPRNAEQKAAEGWDFGWGGHFRLGHFRLSVSDFDEPLLFSQIINLNDLKCIL